MGHVPNKPFRAPRGWGESASDRSVGERVSGEAKFGLDPVRPARETFVMSRFRFRLAAVLSTVLLAGCLGSGPELATRPGQARFKVSLDLASSSLALGEPLHFTVVVTNTGDAGGALSFSSGCGTNFLVLDRSGVIWDDLAMSHRLCTADAPTRELAPGESRTWEGTWDQRTPTGPTAAGDYRIQVSVLSVPHLPVSEAPFSIR